jgi:transcriptional regulator with XRE-family HTH domain
MHDYEMISPIDILAMRERLGWTQDKMAEFLGVDRSSVSRLESGKVRIGGPILRLLGSLIERGEPASQSVPSLGTGSPEPALSPAAEGPSLTSAAGAPFPEAR